MRTQVNANKILLSLFFFAYTLVLFACASVPLQSYDEVVSQWRSYDDVANWMGRYYSYDLKKFKNSLEIYSPENPPPVKTPRESFEEKSGFASMQHTLQSKHSTVLILLMKQKLCLFRTGHIINLIIMCAPLKRMGNYT